MKRHKSNKKRYEIKELRKDIDEVKKIENDKKIGKEKKNDKR